MCLLAAPRPQSPVDEPIAEECLPLVVLLHSLLSSLGRHGHGEAPPGVDGSPPDRWDDDSYTYFESAVAELADCDIDISLHDARPMGVPADPPPPVAVRCAGRVRGGG